jgi:hypothetical protein
MKVQILLEFGYKVNLELQEQILRILEKEKEQQKLENYLPTDLNMLETLHLKNLLK